jgi:hypothetical protein
VRHYIGGGKDNDHRQCPLVLLVEVMHVMKNNFYIIVKFDLTLGGLHWDSLHIQNLIEHELHRKHGVQQFYC